MCPNIKVIIFNIMGVVQRLGQIWGKTLAFTIHWLALSAQFQKNPVIPDCIRPWNLHYAVQHTLVSISAPCTSRSSTVSLWPLRDARWRDENESGMVASKEGRFCNSSRTTPRRPYCDARSNGDSFLVFLNWRAMQGIYVRGFYQIVTAAILKFYLFSWTAIRSPSKVY